MLAYAYRCANYKRQTNSASLTPNQRKRAQKKMNHFLAKKETVKQTSRTI